ncbi:MAG: glycosyltransferase [Baekduia sp.]
MTAGPRLSVLIASYRWPEALELSLASALAQTERRIEVLVIEDGEDTQSRDVVAAAADDRVRWLLNDPPSGGQSGPNALGIEQARAPFVAYLGHDDIWHPRHAGALLDVLDRGVDIAHAATLLLDDWDAPHQRAVSGIEAWTPETFVPPSSIGHVRSGRPIARWTPPAADGRPVDYRFLADCGAAGARIASTGSVTVAKFPAAWRRDSYVTRDVAPQRALVAALATDPGVLERRASACLADGVPSTVPAPPEFPPGVIADHTRRMKGLPALNHPTSRWAIDTVPAGPGWHGLERDAAGAFSWTCGGERAWVRVDHPGAADLRVRVVVAHVLAESQLEDLEIDVGGSIVTLAAVAPSRPGEAAVLEGPVQSAAGRAVEVGIRSPGVRPASIDPGSPDERLLGIAIREIVVS